MEGFGFLILGLGRLGEMFLFNGDWLLAGGDRIADSKIVEIHETARGLGGDKFGVGYVPPAIALDPVHVLAGSENDVHELTFDGDHVRVDELFTFTEAGLAVRET